MELDVRLSTIEELSCDFLKDTPKIAHIDDVRQPCGKEHYFLLAALSRQLKHKKIIEIGTHNGRSTIALHYGNDKDNNQNIIYTYDIQHHLLPNIFDNTNIHFRMDNLFDSTVREANKEHLLSADLIFIDVDPHEGIVEYDMYLWLKENNYKGLLLFDDIHLGPGHMGVTSGNSMQQFWDKIDNSFKLDITSVGHWSGTGLVSFVMESIKISA